MTIVLGFDPSLECCGFAFVDTTTGKVSCGHISLDSKADTESKVQDMIKLLTKDSLLSMKAVDIFAYETQVVFHRPSAGALVGISSIKGCMIHKALCDNRDIRLVACNPTIWTSKVKKDIRIQKILDMYPEGVDSWDWLTEKPKKSLIHNVIDAVGMALWSVDMITFKKQKV